jgi:hypothetical protein
MGQLVIVCGLADETADKCFLRKCGIVMYFNYDCGCGQTYPQDPMIGVRFQSGKTAEFWQEELKTHATHAALGARRRRNRRA